MKLIRYYLLFAVLLCTSTAFARGGGTWTTWAKRPWGPRDAPGSVIELNPDYEGNTITSGKVQTLVNLTGGLSPTQASAGARPTYATNVLNGHSVARGTGVGTYLSTSGTIDIGTSVTIVMVAGTVTGNGYYFSDSASLTAILGGFFGHTYSWFNNGDRGTYADGASGYHIFVLTQANGGNFIGYYDGTQVFSTTATVALGGIQFYLNSGGVAQGMVGDFAYFAAYKNVVLSTVDRQALVKNLGVRFGITTN